MREVYSDIKPPKANITNTANINKNIITGICKPCEIAFKAHLAYDLNHQFY